MKYICDIYLIFFTVFINSCAQQEQIMTDEAQIDNAYTIGLKKLIITNAGFGHVTISPPEHSSITITFRNDAEEIMLASISEKGKSERYKSFFLAVNPQLSTCTLGLVLQKNDSCIYTLILRPDRQLKFIDKDFIVRYYNANNQSEQKEFKLRGTLELKLSSTFFSENN